MDLSFIFEKIIFKISDSQLSTITMYVVSLFVQVWIVTHLIVNQYMVITNLTIIILTAVILVINSPKTHTSLNMNLHTMAYLIWYIAKYCIFNLMILMDDAIIFTYIWPFAWHNTAVRKYKLLQFINISLVISHFVSQSKRNKEKEKQRRMKRLTMVHWDKS